MNDLLRILSDIEKGDTAATDRLVPAVYEELRQLAAARLAHERPGQTLQATALVHEVYLRLAESKCDQRWASRGHFFAAAAEAMRRILIERARRKQLAKHGGGLARVELSHIESEPDTLRWDILALDEALEKLERQHQRQAQVIKLRFFVGLTNRETAEMLNISVSTAETDWAYAKAWLRLEMSRS